MQIGVPDEIKDNEARVGMTPAGVEQLVDDGHDVLIEAGAGEEAGFSDVAYQEAGADIGTDEDVWDTDLTVKIKEPLESEYEFLDEDTTLFTYFHLAADEELTETVLESEMTAIAYETVEEDGDLPLLRPMSQVAGRMAPIMGSYHQSQAEGGAGRLTPGIPGVEPAQVMVLGGGTVGENAARVASGMGADVTVYEKDHDRMEELDRMLDANVDTRISTRYNIREELPETDIVIGAVLVKGAAAPTVIEADDLDYLDDGSVIVDVAVDQGGCVETTEPTQHSDPIYTVDDVVHYAVTNMPAAYPETATEGITNATLPYIRKMADQGIEDAIRDDPVLRDGVNAVDGELTYENVADTFDMAYTDVEDMYDRL